MSSAIADTAAELKRRHGALLTPGPSFRETAQQTALRLALDVARDRLQGGAAPAAQLRLDLTAR